jgi:hypothetical protein
MCFPKTHIGPSQNLQQNSNPPPKNRQIRDRKLRAKPGNFAFPFFRKRKDFAINELTAIPF